MKIIFVILFLFLNLNIFAQIKNPCSDRKYDSISIFKPEIYNDIYRCDVLCIASIKSADIIYSTYNYKILIDNIIYLNNSKDIPIMDTLPIIAHGKHNSPSGLKKLFTSYLILLKYDSLSQKFYLLFQFELTHFLLSDLKMNQKEFTELLFYKKMKDRLYGFYDDFKYTEMGSDFLPKNIKRIEIDSMYDYKCRNLLFIPLVSFIDYFKETKCQIQKDTK